MLGPIVLLCSTWLSASSSIWEVGDFVGELPELDLSSMTPRKFYETLVHRAFVVRDFHDSLQKLAEKDGSSDPLAWFESLLTGEGFIDSLEGELHETRLAPVIHRVKWGYFLEKYKDIDMYAVSRAPESFRRYLSLMPIFSCGGQLRNMQPPNLWVSGGIAASKSVVHADSHFNQHCVLKGSKKFHLIPSFVNIQTSDFGWLVVDQEDGSEAPAGFEDAYGEYAARIDTDNIDLERFPGWKTVPWFSAELREGDCIYMPVNWYHYVESKPELTITWHNWFDLPPRWVEEDECFGSNRTQGVSVPMSTCAYRTDFSEHRKSTEMFGNRTSVCVL